MLISQQNLLREEKKHQPIIIKATPAAKEDQVPKTTNIKFYVQGRWLGKDEEITEKISLKKYSLTGPFKRTFYFDILGGGNVKVKLGNENVNGKEDGTKFVCHFSDIEVKDEQTLTCTCEVDVGRKIQITK
ncbi:MAG: hypothetical protein LBD32_01620 [Cytophagales bacterium]|nr:hypothetical protein [Cytophagales bacterium]